MLYQVYNSINRGDKLLKFLDVKMNEIKPGCTEVLLKFDDNEVSQEKYVSLKKGLKSLKCYMDNDYSIKLGLDYDKYSEQLIIEVTILTPDHLMPKDIETAIKIFMDHVDTFQNFYKAQCLIFDNSYLKASKC